MEKLITQTQIFDLAASEFGRPFTFEELASKLHEPGRGWTAPDGYIKSCIKDRTQRRIRMRILDNGLYEWIGDAATVREEQPAQSLDGLTRRGGLAELTEENADTVCAAIENDPRYKEKARDVFRRITGALPLFAPSAAGNISCGDLYNYFTPAQMYDIVRQIKIDNNIVGCPDSQLILIRDFITDPSNRFFCRNLNGDLSLVEDLNDYLGTSGVRHERSLSSKICAFLNNYLYGGDEYFIYDRVVLDLLPRYRVEYGLPTVPADYYAGFFTAMEDLRSHVCPTLKRRQIDQIIWYTNK